MDLPSFEFLIWKADQELNHLHTILQYKSLTPLANQKQMHEAIERARAELKTLRKLWRDEGRY